MGVSKSTVRLGFYGLILAVAFLAFPKEKRMEIPEHLLHHNYEIVPELLTKRQGNELRNLVTSIGEFHSNAAEGKVQRTSHEHIGEAEPIGPDGKCENPYLIPSVDKTSCVFAGRIDVARNYMIFGGFDGLKEAYETAASRLQSFAIYNYNVSKGFSINHVTKAVKGVCPKGKQVLDPFQFNFLVQVPGQTVAYHLDTPYFWGASRFQFPQWLLVTMQFSNLFRDSFVDQIQVVAYLHEWQPDENRHGEFVFWTEKGRKYHRASPTPLAGLFLDGSKTVHAASVYYPSKPTPDIPKSQDNSLKFLGNDKWALLASGKVIQEYNTDDLRISIVYRGRCFGTEQDKLKFQSQLHEEGMELDEILETFEKDLIRRGKMYPNQNITRFQMAEIMMDEYVKYPMPMDAWIPYNYCIAMKFLPWTCHLLKYFC